MKKRNFPLSSIMMIRKHKECIARRSLIKARQPLIQLDRKVHTLIQEQHKVDQSINISHTTDSLEKKVQKNKEFDTSQLIHNVLYFSNCSKVISELREKRKSIKKEIESVQEQYIIANKKLETIKILYQNFNSMEIKRMNKRKVTELQEIMLC